MSHVSHSNALFPSWTDNICFFILLFWTILFPHGLMVVILCYICNNGIFRYCRATFQKTNNSNQSPLEEFIEVKSLINVLIALLTFCCKLHDKYYPSIKVHNSEAHNLHQLKFLLSNPILHSKNHCTICTWIRNEI